LSVTIRKTSLFIAAEQVIVYVRQGVLRRDLNVAAIVELDGDDVVRAQDALLCDVEQNGWNPP